MFANQKKKIKFKIRKLKIIIKKKFSHKYQKKKIAFK